MWKSCRRTSAGPYDTRLCHQHVRLLPSHWYFFLIRPSWSVGPATVSTVFLPLLKAAAHPRIINISALAGSISDASSREKSHGAFWTYGPSKAALNYITGVLAVANPTVRVVSICPGMFWPLCPRNIVYRHVYFLQWPAGLVSTALTSHAAKGAKPEDAAQFIVDTALQETGPSPAVSVISRSSRSRQIKMHCSILTRKGRLNGRMDPSITITITRDDVV
jgi:NAD(P)-dependent dehydrogenase (short-subunit alcohol dehydrogenase family)